MTLADKIVALLADRPRTGAEIRAEIGGTSTRVHRYLCELRRRGRIAGWQEFDGPIVYTLPSAKARAELNWRQA